MSSIIDFFFDVHSLLFFLSFPFFAPFLLFQIRHSSRSTFLIGRRERLFAASAAADAEAAAGSRRRRCSRCRRPGIDEIFDARFDPGIKVSDDVVVVESREEFDFPRDLLGQMLAFGVEGNPLYGVETRVKLIPHFDDVAETAFADPAKDLRIPESERSFVGKA